MTSRTISTSHSVVICDVCERTLLRGEQAEVFIYAGDRHPVCELCSVRALQSGWVREGYDAEVAPRRLQSKGGRSLLARFRRVTDLTTRKHEILTVPGEGLIEDPMIAHSEIGADIGPESVSEVYTESTGDWNLNSQISNDLLGERQIHAVPTQAEQKNRQAAQIFNASEHCKRISSVARSLGDPIVTMYSSISEETLVMVVFAWEICWYRYEVDLTTANSVRLEGRGSELNQLEDYARSANSSIDAQGRILETAPLVVG